MIDLLMCMRDALMQQSDRVVRKNFSFRMNEAALLFLDDVRLFSPTADAGTLLRLNDVFDSYAVGSLFAELQRILNSCA